MFLKREKDDCSLVERIDLKDFLLVLYKCILGSKQNKKKGKMKENNTKNYGLLSCILITRCLESTSHLTKAHHVCKREITT